MENLFIYSGKLKLINRTASQEIFLTISRKVDTAPWLSR